MGWFSKSQDTFFLATIVPDSQSVPIERYLGLVNGEAIIGANIFRDMFSAVRDVVGGRAGGYERALAGARDAALDELKQAAKQIGADGVIGIDFDYEVLGENNGMMMVSVSGTAVKLAPRPDPSRT
ncbi:MAG: heavy metal-binding domain-containing protein [Burkholderiaceae bacterium]